MDPAQEPKALFVQKFMKVTGKLTKAFGPADCDYIDPAPTEDDLKATIDEQEYSDAHWTKRQDSTSRSYVIAKQTM